MESSNKLTKNWLILAVSALAGAGIYSLPPLIFRAPIFKDILPVEAIFASSLVIHVDLSVLVWMLAIGGMLWSQFADDKYNLQYKSAFYAAALGAILIALAPLTGNLNPLKNNYIPVLQNPVFFIGLGLFFVGVILHILLIMSSYAKLIATPIGYGIYTAALITLIAAACFIIAAFKSPGFDAGDPTSFYEYIFWGGGHILQASYTSLLLVAWFMLFDACGYKNPLASRFVYMIFGINLLVCLPAPFFYYFEDTTALFAAHMRNFIGIAPSIAIITVGYAVIKNLKSKNHNPQGEEGLQPFLIFSLLLFSYGGVLGHMISGVNVTIPAHYHGSIVGITLAFMGLVYHYMPKVGFSAPRGTMARIQPFIYAIGQAMHITGLAVMGGYGALRKDVASSQNIDTMIGKGLFFSGGSLAILGGLLFVVVVFRAMRKR